MPSMSAPSDAARFEAAFYDGKTAVRHRVRVLLSREALFITTDDGAVLDRWDYGEVTFADESSGGVRVAKAGSEARLVIQDHAAYRLLLARAPSITDSKKQARRWMLKSMALAFLVLAGFYVATPYLTKIVVAMTPLSFEERLGKGWAHAFADVLAGDKGICDQGAGKAALEEIVAVLAAASDPIMPYKVEVLDVSMVNAMALPGGYIFVFRGLLEGATSPEELAGVLAHEMAHVDLRHPMHGMVRQYGTEMLTNMMFGGSTLGNVSGFLMSTAYTRDAERDADARALETLRRANISSQGMAEFFARLSASEEKSAFGLPQFLSTHPDSGTRSRLAGADARRGREILGQSAWTALKAICEK